MHSIQINKSKVISKIYNIYFNYLQTHAHTYKAVMHAFYKLNYEYVGSLIIAISKKLYMNSDYKITWFINTILKIKNAEKKEFLILYKITTLAST